MLARRLAFAAAVALAAPAAAQIASPGDLARGHASLEGLSNCTKCHEGGDQVAAGKCLACHTELKERVARGRGFHGRLSETDRHACQNCHHDHLGRDAALIEWPGGQGHFDHARTGWPLHGAHAGKPCKSCHEPRTIVDGEIAALAKKAGKQTFLGVGTKCTTCHFDEHRKQVDQKCESCHAETAWKPAAKFDHASSDFPLKGKHARVECGKCHPSEKDEAAAGAFPAPRSATFMRLAPIDHAHCKDCHADPHGGRFPGTCESCHSVDGWNIIRDAAKERGFHDKTRFPLRGAHASVACATCHGPSPGHPAKFKGLPHEHCTDCHADAHRGQLKAVACERCHTVDGFKPARFELEQHAQTRFPLDGAHQAVACSSCHKDEPIARAAEPAGKHHHARAQARVQPVSAMQLKLPGNLERCETCHEDAHAGQLRAVVDGCRHCHATASFTQVTFDHAKDSRFQLVGKHASLACAACHGAPRGSTVVRYRPLAVTCNGCHRDVHAGQLGADCTRCHDNDDWKKSRFRHDDARFTRFTLDGKHASLACGACHKKVAVGGVEVVRYKPLPRACEECHVDAHKGAFSGFVP